MNRHSPPAFALVAALLVVAAGMVVLVPATAAAPAGGRLAGVDDYPDGGSFDSLEPRSGGTTETDQLGLHAELSTYVSTGSGPSLSRQVESESETDPDPAQRLHRWRCPICDATKLSFSSSDVDPGEAAANNLRSHIRNTDGEGHGPPGTVPEWITSLDLLDSVAVQMLAE